MELTHVPYRGAQDLDHLWRSRGSMQTDLFGSQAYCIGRERKIVEPLGIVTKGSVATLADVGKNLRNRGVHGALRFPGPHELFDRGRFKAGSYVDDAHDVA